MADDDAHEDDEREPGEPPPFAPSDGADAGGDASSGDGGNSFEAPAIQTTSGGGDPTASGAAGSFDTPEVQTTSGGGGPGGSFDAPEVQTTSGGGGPGGSFDAPEVQTTSGRGQESGGPKITPLTIGVIVVVLVLLVGGAAFALTRGGSTSKTATSGSGGFCGRGSGPACQFDSSASCEGSARSCAPDSGSGAEPGSGATCDPSAGSLCTLPHDVVLADCLQIDNQGSSTDVILTFIVTPVAPGHYTVVVTTGVGSLTGSADVVAGATFVAVRVHFTSFTTISGVTITGPNGTIDAGTFSATFPFELNAQTDKATDCDGSKLKAPAPSAADAKTLIATFLDDLAANFRAGDTDGAVAKLDAVVLQIHTADECRATVSTFTDSTFTFVVKSIDGPQPFDYVSGGQTRTVHTVFFVVVTETRRGQPSDLTIHVSRSADGGLHWFTPCEAAAN